MSNTTLPPHLTKIYSADQIAAKVGALGASITQWAESVTPAHERGILAIPILRGGMFFFTDLVRKVRPSVEIAPLRVWAYQNDKFATQRTDLKLNVDDLEVKGRQLLLVDDICDSGRTLRAASEALRQRGAAEVRSAVVIKRKLPEPSFEPDWVAFEFEGPEWFVGYGMEDRDLWSNLPDIYKIPPH